MGSPGTLSLSLGCHLSWGRGWGGWKHPGAGVRQVQALSPFGQFSECIPVSSRGPGAVPALQASAQASPA